MDTYEFSYHSKVPKEFANSFTIKNRPRFSKKYSISDNLELFAFENGILLFVEQDRHYYDFFSNENFKISVNAESSVAFLHFHE